MARVRGFVQEVYDYDTRVGKMWGVIVDGVKYGFGKEQPNLGVGDDVSFEYKENGQYKNVATRTVRVEAKGVGNDVATSSPSGQNAAARSSAPNPNDIRQDVISKQAALNSAMQFVALLHSAEALPVGKTAKPEAKMDIIEGLVDHYKAKFYFQSTGKSLPDESAKTPEERTTGTPADQAWKD